MISLFFINNLDSIQDDWASSNHVANPFSNNIPGIFILKFIELVILSHFIHNIFRTIFIEYTYLLIINYRD